MATVLIMSRPIALASGGGTSHEDLRWGFLAGVLGLLLDYRDGPVRTVQLFVYLMLALGIVRLARVAALASADAPPDTDSNQSVAPRSSELWLTDSRDWQWSANEPTTHRSARLFGVKG